MVEYITLDDLAHTGHDLSLFTDEDLEYIIKTASSTIDSICGQSIGLTEIKDEVFWFVNPSNIKIFPSYNPIYSVQNIKLMTEPNFFEEVKPDNCVVDKFRGIISVFEYKFCVLLGKIDYTYGYEKIPSEVTAASKLIANMLLDKFISAKVSGFSDATTLVEYQEKIIRTATKMSEIHNLLNNYKKG